MQDYFWENIQNPWIVEKDPHVIEMYELKTIVKGNCQDALDLTYLYDFGVETYIQILESVLHFRKGIDAYKVQQIFEKIYRFENIDKSLIIRTLHLEEAYAKIFTDDHKPKYFLDCLKCDPLYSVILKSNNADIMLSVWRSGLKK